MAHVGDNDDDDDYMSEKFTTIPQSNDIRPGLIYQRELKQKYEKEEKHKAANAATKIKPTKQLEKEKLEEGLNSAISSSNKGFALMQKMGYKPGAGIGKKESGSTEPIPIAVKCDRGGLGRDTLVKRQREDKQVYYEMLRNKRQKFRQETEEEFRTQMKIKMLEKQTVSDLRKSQKVCEHLDKEAGKENPKEPWFWIIQEKNEESNSDTEDESSSESETPEIEPSDMLLVLTEYLRNTYKYCIWCGTAYEDDSDMLSNCPGKTADDH